RKVGDFFCVVTPWRRTSSGSRASAWLTRFCTRTVASSASVPGRKVTVICSTPSEPATDLVYIMSSTPLIASSSGVATVSAITFGLAPGYTVRTTTDGGTTSGYSPIGSRGIEIRPAAKITIDSTAAKIGLSMKKREKSMGWFLDSGKRGPALPRGEGSVAGRRASGRRAGEARLSSSRGHRRGGGRLAHGHGPCLHGHAGEEDLLHAADDHRVAGLQALLDDAQAVGHAPDHDVAALRLAFAVHDVDVLAVLVGEHGLVVDQRRLEAAAARQAHAGVQARGEAAVGVVQHGAGADGAGATVDLVVEEVDRALVREAGLVGQRDLHRQRALALAGALAGAGQLRVAQEAAFVGVEVHMHLVQRYHRGQHAGRIAGTDQVAGGDQG